MKREKEINLNELEKSNGGAGFDPFTGKAVPDPIPPKPNPAKEFLDTIRNIFRF